MVCIVSDLIKEKADLKKKLYEILQTVPIFHEGYRSAKHTLKKQGLFNPFLKYSPPGHYNNPLHSYEEILDKKSLILQEKPENCAGIDSMEQNQLDLLERVGKHEEIYSFTAQPKEEQRYYSDNNYFSKADATVLNMILREFKPSQIIEVGSGFSSAVMLDTNDLFMDNSLKFTFIEPFPSRLNSLLSEQDRERCTIINEFVQNVNLDIFDELEENDILFIDSSHVIKLGSDLSRIFFSILPRLKPGVIIHFHDIFWPFEYPLKWYHQGRAYNEAFLLRSFLQYNSKFKILFFPSYLVHNHHEAVQKNLPQCLESEKNGSIYIRKN